MQNLVPANGTEVAAFDAAPGASALDVFVNGMAAEGHQIAQALLPQAPQAPRAEETFDNVPSFAPGRVPAPRL